MMKEYTADTLPPFWWLNPWGLCCRLHTAVRAMQRLAEEDHDRLERLYATLEHERRRVAELEDGLEQLHTAIITGGAIVPDAKPLEGRPNE